MTMCWHKWTRWTQYTAKVVYEGKQASVTEWRQARSCIKCNYWEDKWIRNGEQADFSKAGQ